MTNTQHEYSVHYIQDEIDWHEGGLRPQIVVMCDDEVLAEDWVLDEADAIETLFSLGFRIDAADMRDPWTVTPYGGVATVAPRS